MNKVVKKILKFKCGEEDIIFPVAYIEGESEGPTLAIIGGMHGSEFCGIEAPIKLLKDIEANKLKIKGKLIITTIYNVPAFRENTAFVVPEDNKNPLRLFPGKEKGSYTEVMNYYFWNEVLQDIDYCIELHGGDIPEKIANCIYVPIVDDKKTDSISKKMAGMLRFTERQATAILEMRLYKLIGLEIEALQKEHEETLAKIARYEDILNNYDSMAAVIMEDLDRIKKEFARKRRTVVENAEEAVFEEKKVEEQEIVFLMDRFGYAKTVDVSTYERNKEAADNENKYILHCMNTGRICIFTKDGKMHQVKVMDLPYGKFRDKGQPIDNISNYDSTQEEIVYICDSEQMRYANLLFATKQGMVKKVGGSEFQVTKRTIAATKLQPEDEVVNIRVVTENQHIVLQTADGFFLRFPAAEVTEKKKGAIGVRGIRLKKDDALTNVYLFEEGTECKISYHEKEVTLNRLKLAKRDGTGTKYRG